MEDVVPKEEGAVGGEGEAGEQLIPVHSTAA